MASCAVCGNKFEKRFSSLERFCSPQCGYELSQRKQAKQARREHLAFKRKVRSQDRGYQLKKAQAAFNAYIRERDKGQPCISCGRYHQGQSHAGHYITVKAGGNALRFHEFNCHKQCAPCNNHLSGNIVNYRPRLKEKIGARNLEWLEGPHEPQKLSLEEIKDITAYYKQKLRELQNVQ